MYGVILLYVIICIGKNIVVYSMNTCMCVNTQEKIQKDTNGIHWGRLGKVNRDFSCNGNVSTITMKIFTYYLANKQFKIF